MKSTHKISFFILLSYASGIMGMAAAPWAATKHAGIFPWTYYKDDIVLLFGYDKDHQECISYENEQYETCPSYGDFGGHSKPGETTAQAAIREGNEETNNIYKFTDKDVVDAPYIEANNYRTYLVKVGYIRRKTLLKEAINDEITDFNWVKASDFIATLKDPHATTAPTIDGESIAIKPLSLKFWRAEKSKRRVYDGRPITPIKPPSPISWRGAPSKKSFGRHPMEIEPTRRSEREIHPPRAPEPKAELLGKRDTPAKWLERFKNKKERMRSLRPRGSASYSYSSDYSYSYSSDSDEDKPAPESRTAAAIV